MTAGMECLRFNFLCQLHVFQNLLSFSSHTWLCICRVKQQYLKITEFFIVTSLHFWKLIQGSRTLDWCNVHAHQQENALPSLTYQYESGSVGRIAVEEKYTSSMKTFWRICTNWRWLLVFRSDWIPVSEISTLCITSKPSTRGWFSTPFSKMTYRNEVHHLDIPSSNRLWNLMYCIFMWSLISEYMFPSYLSIYLHMQSFMYFSV